MYFYDVLVAVVGKWSHDTLTYSSEHLLERGCVVVVPFGKTRKLAIVLDRITQPPVLTKDIDKIISLAVLPDASLRLINWTHDYYAAPRGAILQNFLPSALVRSARHQPVLTAGETTKPTELPELTEEQQAVLQKIGQSDQRSFILHGQTGSGKTRVYMELAKQRLDQGQSVLVLTPEIALTPQLVQQFEQSFSGHVLTMHSSLTDTVRRDLWLNILESSKPVIVIGARSALFLPFHKLGLVVVDEAHEPAYKQDETPKYHAVRIASKLAELNNAQLILGSATPSVQDYYVAEQKNIPLLLMTKSASQQESSQPLVEIVDLKDKAEHSGQPYLSKTLLKHLNQALEQGQQAILYLNRRGTARLTLCQVCGWEALCPHCDIPLVFHHDKYALSCHICGYSEPPRLTCPVCGSTELSMKHMGTKSLAENLQRLYPMRKIERFDTDNLAVERLEQRFEAAQKGEIDILIGTQLLAKGLDLPKLGLVGVIQADGGLSLPDFSAAERNFQLLYQVLGRIGRGHTKGVAVIQTFNPNSPAIEAAVARDWLKFYKTELAERKQFRFPPFVYILKLTCSRKTATGAEKAAQQLANDLRTKQQGYELIGPAPAFYEKTFGKYHWQIVVKSPRRPILVEIALNLPSGWSFDLDPTNLL